MRKDKGGAGYKSMGGGGGGKSNGSTAQPSRLTMSRLEQVFIDEDVVIVMVDVFSGVPPFLTWWPPCRGPSFSYLITSLQVPSLPANFGVKKLLSGEPASPLVNDTMSVASGYSTVTGTVIGPSVIARLGFFYELFLLTLLPETMCFCKVEHFFLSIFDCWKTSQSLTWMDITITLLYL